MAPMKQKSDRRAHLKWSLTAGVFFVLILILILTLLIQRNRRQQQLALVQSGVEYLRQLESTDVSSVSEKITAIKKEKRRALLESDESAVWGAFNDAAILGDSRAVGFYTWEFLPQEQVLAQGGGMITDVPGYLDTLSAMQPSMVFLCFGLNDIGIGTWPVAEDYAQTYAENVELLMETLPNAEIYVNSTLPAVGVGLEADPDYPRIGEYNDALEAMCAERGYHYIDNTAVAEAHEDLYQEDGLHVEEDFYIYWATNMIAEAYSE